MGEQPLLRIDEVCERLALGRSFVYRLIQTEQLTSVRIGGARRVLASDLERLVRQLSIDESSGREE